MERASESAQSSESHLSMWCKNVWHLTLLLLSLFFFIHLIQWHFFTDSLSLSRFLCSFINASKCHKLWDISRRRAVCMATDGHWSVSWSLGCHLFHTCKHHAVTYVAIDTADKANWLSRNETRRRTSERGGKIYSNDCYNRWRLLGHSVTCTFPFALDLSHFSISFHLTFCTLSSHWEEKEWEKKNLVSFTPLFTFFLHTRQERLRRAHEFTRRDKEEERRKNLSTGSEWIGLCHCSISYFNVQEQSEIVNATFILWFNKYSSAERSVQTLK